MREPHTNEVRQSRRLAAARYFSLVASTAQHDSEFSFCDYLTANTSSSVEYCTLDLYTGSFIVKRKNCYISKIIFS